ncbi:MAG TPA: arginase family protein [Stackebrandtia sp.]|jgi:arginase|nr:arginase family protein [Stackebrandtia sp.]HZE37436.1 arginase family protein [Stackebrandtia sp.]
MRRIAILDAPSNLGLRPPTPTTVPGCAKAPGALRDRGLVAQLAARDAGCLTPPRFDTGEWQPGDGVSQAAEIAEYSRRLADRIDAIVDAGEWPLVLGGDCSILLGSAVAMRRRGKLTGSRYGLIFMDGHSDFRHPGNSPYVGAAAGEDLALVTGRGQVDLTDIDGHRPYVEPAHTVVLGIRDSDAHRIELTAAGITHRTATQVRATGAVRSAEWAVEELGDVTGFWLHVDVDILDSLVMPAVDSPDPGGIALGEFQQLIEVFSSYEECLGMELTVFDPDYDPDGEYAEAIASTLARALAP